MNRSQILVIDDEPDLLELAQYNLAAAGYDVTCVGSGEEALAAVGLAQPDLVILDVLLPGMDGLDVCKTLKGDAPIGLTQFSPCPNCIFAAGRHALRRRGPCTGRAPIEAPPP